MIKELSRISSIISHQYLLNKHTARITFGKSILQVPDTGTRVLDNTRPFLCSSIVSFWITLASSKERKYHIFGQYWYTKNVPVFTNTGTFQYLDLKYTFSSLSISYIILSFFNFNITYLQTLSLTPQLSQKWYESLLKLTTYILFCIMDIEYMLPVILVIAGNGGSFDLSVSICLLFIFLVLAPMMTSFDTGDLVGSRVKKKKKRVKKKKSLI